MTDTAILVYTKCRISLHTSGRRGNLAPLPQLRGTASELYSATHFWAYKKFCPWYGDNHNLHEILSEHMLRWLGGKSHFWWILLQTRYWLPSSSMWKRHINSEQLVDLCNFRPSVICRTVFKYECCHKISWVSTNLERTYNRMNHLDSVISGEFSNSPLDVRNKNGAYMGPKGPPSDGCLLSLAGSYYVHSKGNGASTPFSIRVASKIRLWVEGGEEEDPCCANEKGSK